MWVCVCFTVCIDGQRETRHSCVASVCSAAAEVEAGEVLFCVAMMMQTDVYTQRHKTHTESESE
jgi:hypothetical protein